MKTKFSTKHWSKPINMNKNLRRIPQGLELGPKNILVGARMRINTILTRTPPGPVNIM